MNTKKIEWVKNPDGTQGYTWNPITGCLNGCEYCYARKLANGRLKSRYLANKNIAVPFYELVNDPKDEYFSAEKLLGSKMGEAYNNPFYPRFWEKRLSAPTPFQKPRGIFVCDMGELFGNWLPERWQEWIFGKIRECRQHRFYLLTKQPQNLIKFSPFPENCWVGVSCDSLQQFAKSWGRLTNIKATIKFISFEPLLERIEANLYESLLLSGVKWVIIGSQTKPYNPPKMKWIDEIVAACDEAKILVFLKNNLMPLVESVFGRENYLSPIITPDGDLRQEMP